MKIQTIKNTSQVNFKSYNRYTEKQLGSNKSNNCISESHLMRNFETPFFATDYAVKNFPNGTNIAVEGCSQLGAYTYGILFHPSNQNKQYKITGYDIVPEVIEDAKLGVLNLGIDIKKVEKNGEKKWVCIRDEHESFLMEGNNPWIRLTTQQKTGKMAFQECFEKVPDTWKRFNICDRRYKHKAEKRLIKPGQDVELTIKRLEYVLLPDKRSRNEGIDFTPKDKVFDGVLSFKVDDVLNIDKEFKQNSVGLISCENVLYHLLGSRVDAENYDNIDINPAKILFKKINSVLQEKGLLVLGMLSEDHLCDENAVGDNYEELKQEGKIIKTFCKSPIHNLLKKLGFEPAFYDHDIASELYLPSVWKKVRHI